MLTRNYLFVLCFVSLTAASCEQKANLRTYTEIFEEPLSAASSLENSLTPLQLTWETPPGWLEEKGKNMRLVTFKSQDAQNPIDCSIVMLPGDAGGDVTNVKRWLGQINVSNVSNVAIEEWMTNVEKVFAKNALATPLLDFSRWQERASQDTPSLIATIYHVDGNTIFVKMTGSQKAISHHKTSFVELNQTLSYQ